eukprot:CAMPEP_0119322690 /NCGR_PEP_ID=MMETSP1333-20130426/58922_1 /TAXON_ID=418940 /ORGANISM="Scyphosphaera apsteinii, Strain RCC1455" /LENGTH=184 /DNA_ID=CAMNT_0007329977 /DNA_START=368 /DNA_END=923 /DNA_ORIENTATION=-
MARRIASSASARTQADIDHKHALPREAERVAQNAPTSAPWHLVHAVHHRGNVTAVGLAPILGIALDKVHLWAPQSCDRQHLFACVDADNAACLFIQADGTANNMGQSPSPVYRRGRETDATTQVDDVGSLWNDRIVDYLSHVHARVCEAIDGMRGHRHHHCMQQATPTNIAEVVNPWVVPVRVL